MRGIFVVLLLGIGFIGLFCKAFRIQLEQSDRSMQRFEQRQLWSPFSKPQYTLLRFSSVDDAPVAPDIGVADAHSKYV